MCFILIRVTVDPASIPGTVGRGLKYTMDGTHYRTPYVHSHMGNYFRKTENLEEKEVYKNWYKNV